MHAPSGDERYAQLSFVENANMRLSIAQSASQMNINALRLFLHIIQRGSLVAAATELNMSPSAASRLLTGLERETGLTLFSRDRQRLRATAEGEQYFKECYRVLAAVDELPGTARRLASGAKARLRLLSNPRFATTLMNPAIGRFMQSNPDIEINLQIVLRYEVELTSSERSFDVGIIALPLKHASVKTEALLDMPATAIMRRDHPLARRAFVRLPELAGQRLVAPARAGAMHREEVSRARAIAPPAESGTPARLRHRHPRRAHRPTPRRRAGRGFAAPDGPGRHPGNPASGPRG
jgi:DNA-binding transcriptional LysR family regulator